MLGPAFKAGDLAPPVPPTSSSADRRSATLRAQQRCELRGSYFCRRACRSLPAEHGIRDASSTSTTPRGETSGNVQFGYSVRRLRAMTWGSLFRAMSWCRINPAFLAVLAMVSVLVAAPAAMSQPSGRRCDASYCYERVCTPGPPICRSVANRVCRPVTRQECTTQNVKKCRKVPYACNPRSTNACRPTVRRVCAPAGSYRVRTYAAELLGWSPPEKKNARARLRRPFYKVSAPATRPGGSRAPAIAQRCQLRVIKQCNQAQKSPCQPSYKDECSYVPEKSCYPREIQDCRDEPRQVCEKGPDSCIDRTSPRYTGLNPGYPTEKPTRAPPPDVVVTPPPPLPTLLPPDKVEEPPPPPPAEPPPTPAVVEPPQPVEATPPAPPPPRVIDLGRIVVDFGLPISGGLGAAALFLLLASRRRKSTSDDRKDDIVRPENANVTCVGRPDAGTQTISHLGTPPIGPRVTVRTVPGAPHVGITLGPADATAVKIARHPG